MDRHTKIICTLGPASSSESMIKKMASRGMNVARLNFSHENHDSHQERIDLVRYVNKKYGYRVSILQDLEGFRMRLGRFEGQKVLKKSKIVYMGLEESDEKDYLPFDYEDSIKKIKINSDVFIEDGKIHLKVVGHEGKRLKLRVRQGGTLTQRKGINIPKLKLQNDIMTDKDRSDLEFGIKNKVEKIAQSFVRNAEDVQRVVDLVKTRLPDCKVIAKIENADGVKNIGEIIESCDGVMVARGDLGVALPIYQIPVLQKYIIRECNRKKKLSMTATQMLESMTEQGRPTRAEVTDVANAILDGSDYVMLSGETAIGKYPSRTIQMMSQIVKFTEKYEDLRMDI